MIKRLESIIMIFVGFVGVLDTSFMIPIISIYAKSLGASDFEAGFIAGFYSIVAIPSSIIAGILVDRFGRKRTLFIGLLWDAISVFLYSLVLNSFQLLILRGFHAIGGSLIYPAFIAKARDISSDRIGYNMGKFLAPIALAVSLGSGISGVATFILGYKISFVLLSIIILLAGIFTLFLPKEQEKINWRGLKGIFEGFREAGFSTALGLYLILVLYIALGIIIGGLGISLYDVVGDDRQARLIVGIGVSLSSLASVFLFLINGIVFDIIGGRVVLLYSVIISTIGFFTAIILTKPITIIISLLTFGFSLSGFLLLSTILVTNVPINVRGTTIGLQQVLNILGVAIGAPIGGYVASFGIDMVLLTLIIFLLLGLLSLIKL
ncbi:MAG: MFS transporter [candidate division WOR-3 bacterium]